MITINAMASANVEAIAAPDIPKPAKPVVPNINIQLSSILVHIIIIAHTVRACLNFVQQ